MKLRIKNELKKLQRDYAAGQTEAALEKMRRLMDKEPTNLRICGTYADMLRALGRYDELVPILEMLVLKVENIKLITNLIGAYLRLNKIEKAEELHKVVAEKYPKDLEVLRIAQRIETIKKNPAAALKIALEVVSLDPKNPSSHNNLGVTLSDMLMFDQAKIAFETVLALDPENIDALQNIAYIAIVKNNDEEAIKYNEKALEILEKNKINISKDRIKWPLSFCYLRGGNLKKGWEYYDSGFNLELSPATRRSPNRKFKVPRWEGQDLKDKSILVWREQGLGDEIRYLSCIHDLIDVANHVVLESDLRLVKVLKESFPSCSVRPALWDESTGLPRYKVDYDYHISIASLPRYLRNTREAFLNPKPYIIPDRKLKQEISEVFQRTLSPGLKVGFSWRSGNIDNMRSLSYLNLVEWSSILKLKGCNFINLQYGDVEGELSAAEKNLGVKIHRWPDLDLKNDLEATFALMSELDLVISVGNAVASMSPAVGTETWQLLPQEHWVELPGLKLPHYPWSDKLKNFHGNKELGIKVALINAGEKLAEMLKINSSEK
ncbi:tetratricopeptide repeat protein [Shewanella sp.]|uniref:tetratricopeptide repeat protein n=1 Tax=Shewanella sp. TaxID=50422 RepID=UPI004047E45C